MKRISNPLVLLFAAILCFLAASLLQVRDSSFAEDYSATRDLDLVTERALAQVQLAEQDISRVTRLFQNDSLTFSSLLRNTHFPCFVYEQGFLVLWSDHTISFDSDIPPGHPRIFPMEQRFGKFLVVQEDLPRGHKVFVLIPLETNYGIQNDYLSSVLNPKIFNSAGVFISLEPQSSAQAVYGPDGSYLFNILLDQPMAVASHDQVALVLLSIGILLFISYLVLVWRLFLKDGQYLKGGLVLIVPLLLLRLGLLYFNYPYSIVALDFFDPKYYASSSLSPSLGDLVINAVLLLVIIRYGYGLFRRYELVQLVHRLSPRQQIGLKVGVMVAFYLMLFLLFQTYYSIFSNSLPVMDVTQNLQFSVYRILLYVAIMCHTVSFLFVTYALVQTFYALREIPAEPLLYMAIVLVVLAVSFWDHTGLANQALLLAFCLGFFLSITLVDLRKSMFRISYKSYLFFFIIFAISGLVGSLAIYRYHLSQLQVYKQKYATRILLENDIEGEFLLKDVSDKIKEDPLLKNMLMSPFVNQEFIKQKIQKYYLKNYFDKYESSVKLFDTSGYRIGQADSAMHLDEYQYRHLQRAVPTDHEGLYLIQSGSYRHSRKYVKFIPVQVARHQKCMVVLELELKKMLPYSVVPELLQDQQFTQPYIGRNLSYGIFDEGQLQYAEGSFDFSRDLDEKLLRLPAVYQDGVTVAGTHHYAVRSTDGRTLVLTTPRYPAKNLLSNFSFLFLVHTGGLLFFMIGTLVVRGGLRSLHTNFSTKIQIFLNFGVLIPLILVCVATVSLVTNSYKRDLLENYQKQGQSIQENLLNYTGGLRRDVTREQLTQLISALAKFSETDINIFDNQGYLITTSQPLIFETGLLSQLINPHAMVELTENRNSRVLLTEQAGLLQFNSLYLPIRNGGDGRLTGFIGLPFFDSEKDLSEKLIDLITTVMNIFTLMFITFMILTFVAARALTVPLKLITEKLKRTTLTGKNEMLAYTSADEIGLLVSEYNQMLLKLEQSKQELAMREKEAAWREMARQVAHEIKNPLTPMKLSIQYLLKAISEKRDNTLELAQKISNTMITQIDILSDIATSFSNFTTLPELKPEPVDLALVLKRTTDLHQEPSVRSMVLQVAAGDWVVIADENLMFRTFNNLIINALQAIPGGRFPKVEVVLQPEGDREVLVKITDNGTGIPEEIRKKVFVPNFSTKYSGSGIGLAVARKGIESAGGSIWFETQEKEGTTFFIKLPLARE